MGFPRQEYWSGFPLPYPWDFPDPGMESMSPPLTNGFFKPRGMETAMAPHSSTLAWEVPWMEEPGGLQSVGSQRVGYDWGTPVSLFTFMRWRRKWQPTPVFLPGEVPESDTTEATYQQATREAQIMCYSRINSNLRVKKAIFFLSFKYEHLCLNFFSYFKGKTWTSYLDFPFCLES